MQNDRVPGALLERLGPDGYAGLLELLEGTRSKWTAEVLMLCSDRFERRLVEETSKLRVEMAEGFASLRQEIAGGLASVRTEMAAGLGSVRQEMAADRASLRQEKASDSNSLRLEMAQGFARISDEMARHRFEILKWTFLFWVGQFFAMASLMAVLVRVLRGGI